MYVSFRNAFVCAFPMNAYPSMPTPISCNSPADSICGAAPIPVFACSFVAR